MILLSGCFFDKGKQRPLFVRASGKYMEQIKIAGFECNYLFLWHTINNRYEMQNVFIDLRTNIIDMLRGLQQGKSDRRTGLVHHRLIAYLDRQPGKIWKLRPYFAGYPEFRCTINHQQLL